MTRVAIVGHVEWVQFIRVERFPVAGEIQRAQRESTHAGGGAVVAAAVLAQHGAEVDFYGAVGTDAIGDAAVRQLTERGINVYAARRPGPTREVLTLLDQKGERTILPIGERLQPEGADELAWDRLSTADAVYVTAADQGVLERLDRPDVYIDALIFSGSDEVEIGWARRLESDTRLMVATDGGHGGRWWGESEGRWQAVPPPGPIRDSYGGGDSFAAGVTYGLAEGRSVGQACDIGARWGAEMLTRVGAP